MKTKNDSNTENSSKSFLGSADTEITKVSKSKATEKNIPPLRFTKEQLVQSTKYKDNSDLLNALLEDGHSYTSEEAEGMIQAFHKKGGV